MAGTGDHVVYPLTLQRLEKSDLTAMASLIEDTITRMGFGLLGETYGCGSRPTFDTSAFVDSSAQTVGVSACLLVASWNGAAEPNCGRVVIYDPDRSVQTATGVPNVIPGTTAYLWFSRSTSVADEATRVYRTAGASDTTTTTTRSRERVEFVGTATSSDSTYNPDTGWFLFATVTWSGFVPTITPVPWWEGKYCTTTKPPLLSMGAGWDGLGEVVRATLAQLLMILDSDWHFTSSGAMSAQGTDTLLTLPTRGLRQLNADLVTQESGPRLLGIIHCNPAAPSATVVGSLIAVSGLTDITVPVGNNSPDDPGTGLEMVITATGRTIHAVTGQYYQGAPLAGSDNDDVVNATPTEARRVEIAYGQFADPSGEDGSVGSASLKLHACVFRLDNHTQRNAYDPTDEPFDLFVWGI